MCALEVNPLKISDSLEKRDGGTSMYCVMGKRSICTPYSVFAKAEV